MFSSSITANELLLKKTQELINKTKTIEILIKTFLHI